MLHVMSCDERVRAHTALRGERIDSSLSCPTSTWLALAVRRSRRAIVLGD
jgi:hypothetical protein